MAGVRLTFEVFNPAGGGGTYIDCSVPASLNAWDALTPTNGFVRVTTAPDANGNTEVRSVNQSKVQQVVALP